jgi:hypothetical protein
MSEERYESNRLADDYWLIRRVRDNVRIGSILQVGQRFVSYDSIQISHSYDDAYKAVTGVKP